MLLRLLTVSISGSCFSDMLRSLFSPSPPHIDIYFPLVVISLVVIYIGYSLDAKFWENENQKSCEALRSNPACIEDECGFICLDSDGTRLSTGGSVCPDKDMKLCKEKEAQLQQSGTDTQTVLSAYSTIVDKIIASPAPSGENFENKLVAIYNCLESRYGSGATGETMAVKVLAQKNLDQGQLQKYYEYLSSKGRRANTSQIVAGLPNGDKALSCNDVK